METAFILTTIMLAVRGINHVETAFGDYCADNAM